MKIGPRQAAAIERRRVREMRRMRRRQNEQAKEIRRLRTRGAALKARVDAEHPEP